MIVDDDAMNLDALERVLRSDYELVRASSAEQAIEILREQQAKSVGLRAGMGLARLRRSQGKQIEAHEMLATIYGRFTECFDTTDLREAKALLHALAEEA